MIKENSNEFIERLIDLEKRLGVYIIYEPIEKTNILIVDKLLERIEKLEEKLDNL